MLRVWVDNASVGLLDRHGRGSAFAYDVRARESDAVSITMPVRTASWDVPVGLLPIFDMNMPEGALREILTRRFAKATGNFDNFDLLGVVGRSQIGRLRYSAPDANPEQDVPFQSVDEILKARRGGELYEHLLERFAEHSGLSGVQPKVLIRAEVEEPELRDRLSASVRGATHIVKFWDPNEYPELAANEFFCLSAARDLGLTVPDFDLSDDGAALVVKRFDLRPDGGYQGFEDFCVLNALVSADKYSGSYETRLFKRVGEFTGANRRAALESLFRLFVLNCAIRNGDAHLKNFGLSYDDATEDANLAPVYDLVTTRAYIRMDAMALTLGGTTRWPDRRKLVQLGQTRADLGAKQVSEILEATADSLARQAVLVQRYFIERSKHPAVGQAILEAWQDGVSNSLGATRGWVSIPSPEALDDPDDKSFDFAP